MFIDFGWSTSALYDPEELLEKPEMMVHHAKGRDLMEFVSERHILPSLEKMKALIVARYKLKHLKSKVFADLSSLIIGEI